jgi:hypothetical protein
MVFADKYLGREYQCPFLTGEQAKETSLTKT